MHPGTTQSKCPPPGHDCSFQVSEDNICSGLCLFLLNPLGFFSCSSYGSLCSSNTCCLHLSCPFKPFKGSGKSTGLQNNLVRRVLYLHLHEMQTLEQVQHAHLATMVFPWHHYPCAYRTLRPISRGVKFENEPPSITVRREQQSWHVSVASAIRWLS